MRLASRNCERWRLNDGEGVDCVGAHRCCQQRADGTVGKTYQVRTCSEYCGDVAGIDLKVNPCGWRTGAIPSTVRDNQSVLLGERKLIGPRRLTPAASPVDEHNRRTFAIDRAVQHDLSEQLRNHVCQPVAYAPG